MVIDTMTMNQDYLGEGSRNIPLDEEPNVNEVRFFEFLKDSDK
jgi:hypothetical protein